MAVNIRKILQGLGLIPAASSTISAKGEMEVLNSDGRLYLHDGSTVHKVTTNDTTDTLTNKSLDGGSNTFTNLPGSAVTGTVAIANGGTGQTTQQAALDALAGAVTSGSVLRGDGTHVTLSAIQASDVPTLNQNTTGTAANVTATTNATLTTLSSLALPSSQLTGQVPIANGGTGAATKSTGFDALSPMTTSGDVIYGGASGTGTRLAKGSDGNVLTLASGVPSWAAPAAASPLTTKGDLYGYSTTNARLPVGTDGQTLVADSSQTLGIKWGAGNGARTINAQSGTTYTFVLSDGSNAGGNPLVTATNSAAQTYTVPPNSSVAYPVGAQIDITQLGAGLVTLAAGAGVTLNSSGNGLTMLGQYSAATLVKTATDTWEVYGTGTTANMPLTDWQTGAGYTINNFGTTTNNDIRWRRVGDSMEIVGKWTNGTTAAAVASFALPSGFTIDSTKMGTAAAWQVGLGYNASGAGSQLYPGNAVVIFYDGSDTSKIYFANSGTAGTDVFTKTNASTFTNNGVGFSIRLVVPISGWTSGASYSSAALSLTDWIAYTPTFSAPWGTVVTQSFWYRRIGDSVQVRGNVTPATSGSGTYTISLPSGLAVDSSKSSGSVYFILGSAEGTQGSTWSVIPIAKGGDTVISLTRDDQTTIAPFSGSLASSGSPVTIDVMVPISGWTSTGAGTLTAPRTQVTVDTYNTYGSNSGNKIPRFSNIRKNLGSAITYLDDSANGATFTINETGVYSIHFVGRGTGGSEPLLITVNDSALTTAASTPLTYAQGARGFAQTAGTSFRGEASWTENLTSGDIVRPHTDGGTLSADSQTMFTITKVSN